MFQSARLKLTAWYLLIIMTVSLAFSAVIYQGVSIELQRRFQVIEHRLELQQFGIPAPPPDPVIRFVEDLQIARHRIFLILLYTNIAILIISSVAGYFLAGKTLKPIEITMDKQKKFVADASHELRTPLTALKTSMEVALRDHRLTLRQAKAEIQDNLQDIDRLHLLTDKLINLTRLQSGSIRPLFKPVSVKHLTNHALKKISPQAKTKHLQIKLNTPSVSIEGDHDSLEEMLTVFLDNAVKYTPDGGQITLSAQPVSHYLVIKIKDTGIGIDPRHLPHLFDRFYRADQSRAKTATDGFGLGLSLAQEIINLHHGSVKVLSTPGKGSTFTIKLPLKHST
jgi:two-component system sensor histidine kinase CiaH